MVPSWAGAAGSAGLAAAPVVDAIDEKHSSMASPVMSDMSLRMGVCTSGNILYQRERRLYPLFKTTPPRDGKQQARFI
jgi:hypothetical protein